MECRSCKGSITALLDGELSSTERKQVGAHLDQCQDCRDTFNRHRLAAELTNQLSSIRPAPDLWKRIQADIAPSRNPGLLSWLFDLFSRPWVPTAAFGTVAAVILLFVLIPGTDPLEEEFQLFMERREHLQNYHERLLFRGPFDRKRLGRNPFSIPVSLEYQNPFEE